MKSSSISTFLPALCLFPVWLTIVLREDILVTSLSNYYPMMIAMIFGSMIAGSTPLGGGVVAFPISVLVLGFTPTQGRDFSLMIQSIGMTAASFLIFYKKSHLLIGGECESILVKFCILSIIGLILGFELLKASPYIVNIVYTTTVVCIAIILAYSDYIKGQQQIMTRTKQHSADQTCVDVADETQRSTVVPRNSSSGDDVESADNDDDDNEEVDRNFSSSQHDKRRKWNNALLNYICLPIFAISGGILSSQIGSGADIACFFYGSLVNAIMYNGNELHHNKATQTQKAISGNALTAASVIIMANTSIFGSILRLTTRHDHDFTTMPPVNDEVYYALTACAPIVVLGAPIGSLFLTPSNQQWLRYLFYILSVLQLLSFGVIKIGNDYVAWVCISCLMLFILICLSIHYYLLHYYQKP